MDIQNLSNLFNLKNSIFEAEGGFSLSSLLLSWVLQCKLRKSLVRRSKETTTLLNTLSPMRLSPLSARGKLFGLVHNVFGLRQNVRDVCLRNCIDQTLPFQNGDRDKAYQVSKNFYASPREIMTLKRRQRGRKHWGDEEERRKVCLDSIQDGLRVY